MRSGFQPSRTLRGQEPRGSCPPSFFCRRSRFGARPNSPGTPAGGQGSCRAGGARKPEIVHVFRRFMARQEPRPPDCSCALPKKKLGTPRYCTVPPSVVARGRRFYNTPLGCPEILRGARLSSLAVAPVGCSARPESLAPLGIRVHGITTCSKASSAASRMP